MFNVDVLSLFTEMLKLVKLDDTDPMAVLEYPDHSGKVSNTYIIQIIIQNASMFLNFPSKGNTFSGTPCIMK